MIDYLQGLNDRQKEAVLHMDGPIMIVAGAGSGKTKVLTTRVVHLMANGVDAFNILALTFTNKAAREMKERVAGLLKAQGARVLGDGNPKIGAHGKPVLFLHPKDFCGTLVELEQV